MGRCLLMKIKRYVVREMQEAIRLIKQDLGPEAVIVSSYKVPAKGLLGLFSPRLLEVTAAIDENPEIRLNVDCPPAQMAAGEGDRPEITIGLSKSINKVSSNRTQAAHSPARAFLQAESTLKDSILRSLPNPLKTGADPAAVILPKGSAEKLRRIQPRGLFETMVNKQVEVFHMDSFTKWRKALVDLEIQEKIVEHLIYNIKSDAKSNGDKFQNFYLNLLKQVVNLLEPAYRYQDQARILAFVGPSGMGKTTTLLKLATRFSLYEQKRIALVAVYTYRLGAVEQLKAYGDFLGIPVDVVMTPAELRRVLDKYADKDYIFIDTGGRSARNISQILELKGFLDLVDEPKDVFLVLNTAAKSKDLTNIAYVYRKINFSKLIFTCVDETETLGSILNLVCTTGVPVTYLADGQGIPDDISEADPKKIAKLLFRGVDPYEVMAI